MKIAFCKTRNVRTPVRGSKLSAGLDFYVPKDFNDGHPKRVLPGEAILIPSGLKLDFQTSGVFDCAFVANNKSGVCTKNGVIVGANIVDMDYQGEIHLHVMNVGKSDFLIAPDMKIVQFLLLPIFYPTLVEVEESEMFKVNISSRGDGGFGSTGI